MRASLDYRVLRVKDFNTKALIYTASANPRVPKGATQAHQWEEQGHPERKIVLYIREAVTLSGFWTYRSFNPTYVTGDQRKAGDAPFFVEIGEAGVAVGDAMRHQHCVQLVG